MRRSALLLCLSCVLAATCGQRTLTAPFVEVTLTNLPVGATQVQVDVTFAGMTRTNTNLTNTLDRFTISLPADAVGPISLQASVKNSNNCVTANGTANETIVANEVYKVTVPLQATAMPICPGGAPVTISVTKTGGGGGNIVATPPSLSCDSTCTSKMAQIEPGTVVSLNVDTLATGASWTSTFDGWSGACTGTTTCFIPVAQAATVTARFSCHGWCPENPTTETNNLNAVWGFSPTRVIAVGDGGTILQWDGSSWKRVASNVTANLRSVHGVSGGTGYVVGAGGTILKTTDSGSMWMQQNSMTTRNLRGVFTFDGSDTFAVGDNIMSGVIWLRGDGTNWSTVNRMGADHNWNALWGLSSPNLYVVGEMGQTAINNPFSIPTPATSNALYGVYGTSASTLIAVGVGKTILRLNGTSWTAMMPPPGTGFPVLRAIHGTSANQMYTVGDNGTVWSFDGTSWSVESFPVQTQLNGVFVFSPTEIYVVGQGGLIYHKKP